MSSTKKYKRTQVSKPPAGGEFLQCEKCGVWFTPVFKKQTTCIKCRKAERYKECHSHAPKVLVVV